MEQGVIFSGHPNVYLWHQICTILSYNAKYAIFKIKKKIYKKKKIKKGILGIQLYVPRSQLKKTYLLLSPSYSLQLC